MLPSRGADPKGPDLVREVSALGRLIEQEIADREAVVQGLDVKFELLQDQLREIRSESAAYSADALDRLRQEQAGRELAHDSLRDCFEELARSVADKIDGLRPTEGGGGEAGSRKAIEELDLQLRQDIAQMFGELLAAHEEHRSIYKSDQEASDLQAKELATQIEECCTLRQEDLNSQSASVEQLEARIAGICAEQKAGYDEFYSSLGASVKAMEEQLKSEVSQSQEFHRANVLASLEVLESSLRAEIAQSLEKSLETSRRSFEASMEALEASLQGDISKAQARSLQGAQTDEQRIVQKVSVAFDLKLKSELAKTSEEIAEASEQLRSQLRSQLVQASEEQEARFASGIEEQNEHVRRESESQQAALESIRQGDMSEMQIEMQSLSGTLQAVQNECCTASASVDAIQSGQLALQQQICEHSHDSLEHASAAAMIWAENAVEELEARLIAQLAAVEACTAECRAQLAAVETSTAEQNSRQALQSAEFRADVSKRSREAADSRDALLPQQLAQLQEEHKSSYSLLDYRIREQAASFGNECGAVAEEQRSFISALSALEARVTLTGARYGAISGSLVGVNERLREEVTSLRRDFGLAPGNTSNGMAVRRGTVGAQFPQLLLGNASMA